MKKFYSFIMALVAVVCCSFSADAQTLKNYIIEPNPGSTVDSFSYFEITFPDTEDDWGVDGDDSLVMQITVKKGGETVATGTDSYDWTNDLYTRVYVPLSTTITEAGTYTVTIPAGTFSNYNNMADVNEEISFDINVSGTNGIEGVEAEAPVVKGIYNLQGMRVNGDRNSLAPGIYVIDGKKVAVK